MKISPFSLKYGYGGVLEPFLGRVFSIKSIRRLILVSPWLSHFSFYTGNTNSLINRLRIMKPFITIITREPDDENTEHQLFIEDVANIDSCEIFFLEDLHAKYYICQTSDQTFAIVGSPNMYKWTKKSFEIGITIESRGEGELIIEELEQVTMRLRLPSSSKVFKKLDNKRSSI